jgi:hypothetical protein
MLSTKGVGIELEDIPNEWVFEHYLNLNEKLCGQDVKIRSVFNSSDTKPSLAIYCTPESGYLWRDFSAGMGGDRLKLVVELFKLSRGQAAFKIKDDYALWLKTGGVHKGATLIKYAPRVKWEIKDLKPRNWNILDARFWKRFQIDSKTLEKYGVVPIESYKQSGDYEEFTLNPPHLYYGYFQKDVLYKIYQPYKKLRFVQVAPGIGGLSQLEGREYLVICSSLKDAMSFTKLGFKNAEPISPQSEGVLLKEEFIVMMKEKYKKVVTLFDNDEAGLRAMLKYKELFNLEYAHLKLEKDLSDSIAAHGLDNVRVHLYPVLTKALTGKAKTL